MKAAAVSLMVVCIFVALMAVAGGQSFQNCTEFGFQISHNCCCTANCCREAEAGEVAHVRDNLYRIVPSGQLIERTGWSPDGRTVRCACDFIDGQWVSHPKALTRCLYLPMPNS